MSRVFRMLKFDTVYRKLHDKMVLVYGDSVLSLCLIVLPVESFMF